MPEGDTIHKLAARLREHLVGRRIDRAESRWEGFARGLAGRTVVATEARGKNLLVHLGDDLVLRVHLGLLGVWHAQAVGDRWRRPADQWALTLVAGDVAHHVFRPLAIERLDPRALAMHPVLSALGPDLALPDVEVDAILARAGDPAYADWPIQDLLLCQQVAAGIGNVFKSELLFLHKLDPQTPVRDVPEPLLRALFVDASRLIRINLAPGPRNTTGRPWPRTWVYDAKGRGCPRCRGPLRHEHQGKDARVTWWCPRCQRRPVAVAR